MRIERGRWVCDLACCFSLVGNGEIIKPYLYSLWNRLSNQIKFTDIGRYGAPLYGISVLANVQAVTVRDGAANTRLLLTLKVLKAKEINMELTSVYGDEALQI
jgi:hypothetical protein